MTHHAFLFSFFTRLLEMRKRCAMKYSRRFETWPGERALGRPKERSTTQRFRIRYPFPGKSGECICVVLDAGARCMNSRLHASERFKCGCLHDLLAVVAFHEGSWVKILRPESYWLLCRTMVHRGSTWLKCCTLETALSSAILSGNMLRVCFSALSCQSSLHSGTQPAWN